MSRGIIRSTPISPRSVCSRLGNGRHWRDRAGPLNSGENESSFAREGRSRIHVVAESPPDRRHRAGAGSDRVRGADRSGQGGPAEGGGGGGESGGYPQGRGHRIVPELDEAGV